jgi:hypothetical protein
MIRKKLSKGLHGPALGVQHVLCSHPFLSPLASRCSSGPEHLAGNEPADSVLLGEAVAGDERAFEGLVSLYQHALLKSIRRLRSTLANSLSLA